MNESKPSPETPGNGDAGTAVIHDLEALQTRISDAEQKRDEYLDLLQRTRADFENYQKRALRETIQERKYAHTDLAHDLLAALDNLDRATTAARQACDKSPLAQGVTLVQTQLVDILRRHGITPIEAQGKPFDPNQHQAVMQQPSPDLPPNSVLQVLEQGFLIHDRVLRPAKVIVSAAP
jgi:molecular chaperone GrpE